MGRLFLTATASHKPCLVGRVEASKWKLKFCLPLQSISHALWAGLLTVITLLLVCTAIYAGEGIYKGGPYYYRYIKENTVTYEPVGEINYEEANNLYTYYEAYFDADGRIITLKRYVKGELDKELLP